MTDGDSADRLAAEQRARVLIGRQLTEAGWSVQDRAGLDILNHTGVAPREAVISALVTQSHGHGG